MSKVVESVSEVIGKYAAECGVEVIDIEYKKGCNGMELTIFIDCDREGGVSLEDCERLHRAIDPVLDELDPTDGRPYQLSVSSPGLDRPLKTERDYKKNLNNELNISLFEKVNGYKRFNAVLNSYDFNKGVVNVTTTEKKPAALTIELKNIALIKPEIKFE